MYISLQHRDLLSVMQVNSYSQINQACLCDHTCSNRRIEICLKLVYLGPIAVLSISTETCSADEFSNGTGENWKVDLSSL